MSKLTMLIVALLSFNVNAANWYKDKQYLGNTEGFDLYLVREPVSNLSFDYTLELRGKNKGCRALDKMVYLDLRWSGYLYKCKDIKNGLVITPSTRSGRSMFTSVIEQTRSGDYLEVSGITTRPIKVSLK